jgi:hypothetical protein
MAKIGNVLIIIAALGLEGNVVARPPDGPARAANVVQRRGRRVNAMNATGPRARKKREVARPVSSGAGPRRNRPAGQPANLAPQPEDVPPVKPPKKKLPPADKRNPG